MATAPETMRQVRVPLSDILAGGGSITMDDVRDAADGGDDAVTHFMAVEQAGPRVDQEPGALLGEDMRPIQPAQGQVEQPSYGAPSIPMDNPVPPGIPDQKAGIENDPAIGGEQRGPRQRITPTTRFNPNQRYTNEDFYGAKGQDIYSTNVFGQKLFMPRAGELPMGLFASYAQQNQQQRAQNKEAIAKLLGGAKGLETADPYQPAFTKLVTDWQNNYVGGIAEQYGGNQELAWREVATPGTAANKGYLDGMAAMDSLGQFVKFQWGDAKEYIKQVMDASINTTPEQKQRAYDVYYGIGNLKGDGTGGDFTKLAQNVEALKRDMNTSKWINERFLPMAPEVYRKLMDEPVAEIRNGKRFLRLRTTEEAQEGLYDWAAGEGERVTGVPRDELAKALRFAIPQTKSDTYTMVSAETSGGGGDGGSGNDAENGVWFGEVERGVSPLDIESSARVADEYTMGNAIRGEVQKTKAVVDRLPIGEIVSKRRQNMGPRKFTDEKGKPIEMRPQYIERDANGAFYVIGRPVTPENTDEGTSTETTRPVALTAKGGVTEWVLQPDGTEKRVEVTKKAGSKPQPDWVRIPVSSNESTIDSYMGGSDWRKAFGSAPSAPTSKKASDPLGILK